MKRRKRSDKTKARNRNDRVWSEIVRVRDGGCIIGDVECAGYLNAHHLIPRQRRATRWELDNGVTLCAKHHVFDSALSAHGAPLAFAEWLQANLPGRWEYAQAHKGDELEWKETLEWIEQEHRRLLEEREKMQ